LLMMYLGSSGVARESKSTRTADFAAGPRAAAISTSLAVKSSIESRDSFGALCCKRSQEALPRSPYLRYALDIFSDDACDNSATARHSSDPPTFRVVSE